MRSSSQIVATGHRHDGWRRQLRLTMTRLGSLSLALALGLGACGGAKSSDGTGGSGGGAGAVGTGGSGGSRGTGGSGGADTGGSGGTVAPPTSCPLPLDPVDTSTPDHLVGTGSAASCSEAAFRAAAALGGKITFNCGGAATIALTQTVDLPTTLDTTIDGGNQITLDGGGKVRLLRFNDPNYRTSRVTVTLQQLALSNGRSTGTALPAAPAPCSQGTDTDGGGAAIYVRNGVLHVIDSVFANNNAPALGPDVGGGGIYALGSLGVIVEGSTFTGNSGSNSGAIGMLNSDLQVIDSVFSGNKALGSGENTIDTSKCSVRGGEIGNGGNAGAIGIDGGDDGSDTFCGDTFMDNVANELGGVLGRTPDQAEQTTSFNLCTFAGNKAKNGGALYLHNSDLVITGSTFSGNSATGSGAIQADGTTFDFTNVTFSGNSATDGLGGALALFGNGGTIVNCTFAGNTAPAGSGFFAAAISGGTALTIRNTIFAGNTTMDCGSPMACSAGASTGDGNVQWPMVHAVCSGADTPCTPSTTFADAMLGPLQDNGGDTQTQLPAAGSPALGIGVNCPATDQRGMPRPKTGCAAGAVQP